MGEERDRRRIGAQPLATTLRFRLLREEFGPEGRADARTVRPYIGGEGMGKYWRGVDGRGNAIFGRIGRYLFGRDCDWGIFLDYWEYSLEFFLILFY